MRSNFALRTLLLLGAWLLLQNFNLAHIVDGTSAKTDINCSDWRKSMESIGVVPYSVAGNPQSLFGMGELAACSEALGLEASPRLRWASWLPAFAEASAGKPPYKIKTIVLDAGHGGKDPGCSGPTSKEKDNALAIVLQLGGLLEANFPNIKVIYTRDSDVFVELNERAAIANRNNADLFICVHCNALSRASYHGAETYVLGLHKVGDNLEVAKRENASIYLEDDYEKNYQGYDPNSTEAHIFGSTWQSAYLEQSILLAQYVQQFAKSEAFREDRGVKQAGFLVLKETAMPSVLIETGYLTNAAEDLFLASEEGQEQTALAIFKAIRAYKIHMEDGQSSVPASTYAYVKPVTKKSLASTSTKGAVLNTKPPGANKTSNPGNAKQKDFRIFLLSWPNRLDPNAGQLSLLSNVKEEYKGGKYYYYMGQYNSRADAEKVLPEIKNLGFKTANITQ